MKKILLLLTFFSIISPSNAQSINVNTTLYTVPQLVENVLFGSESNTGTGIISNITWSTGSNLGPTNGIGYFTNTNPNLPITSGIVLTTGSASSAPGPNNSTLSDGNWAGDAQLFNYINGLGIDPGLVSYNDATIIEFDFIPLIDTMEFNFVFASEEYGTFQCTFSDAFAFFVSDLTDGTPPQNIALVPNSASPISVVTIRDVQYNTGCPSINPDYFDNYYQLPQGTNPALAPINYNGHTVVMTAASSVIPNHTYHLKLVIADRNDSVLDSAVFLSEGSFYMGQELRGAYGSGFEDYSDFTIQNGAALCNQETRRINLGVVPITNATYEWSRNNVVIDGATSHFYDIAQAGEYRVTMRFPNNGQITDTFTVEYYQLAIENPVDLANENLIFNLNENTTTILNGQNPSDYEIYYFNTLADAQNVANPISNTSSYNGFNGQEIFVSIEELNGFGCRETRSFTLYQTLSNDSFNSFDVVHHPNPIRDVLHLNSQKNIQSVQVINLLGQELLSETINQNTAQIDLSTFSSGTYVVKINAEDAQKVIKIIKN